MAFGCSASFLPASTRFLAALELAKARHEAASLLERPGLGVVEGAGKRGFELKCHCGQALEDGRRAKPRRPGEVVAGTLEQDRS